MTFDASVYINKKINIIFEYTIYKNAKLPSIASLKIKIF